jgi:hypothetical protein
MSKFNAKSMFEAIKQSLNSSETKGDSAFKDVMKFEPGHTYQVRLLPNPTNPAESIFHFYQHMWTSNSTGKFIAALCPTTFGQKCPIDTYYLNTYRNGTASEKEAAKGLSRKEGWMVNVYVISDPTTPENEGKVKILRFSKELNKVIQNALVGDDAEEFGVEKVFDLVSGSTLRIKCEPRVENGRAMKGKQFITYASSRFLSPSELDLSEERVNEVFESVHDLKAVFKPTTPAEMQRLLDEHFFNLTTGSTAEDEDGDEPAPAPKQKYTPPVVEYDDEDGEPAPAKPALPKKTAPKPVTTNDVDDTDEKLKKLLAEL